MQLKKHNMYNIYIVQVKSNTEKDTTPICDIFPFYVHQK